MSDSARKTDAQWQDVLSPEAYRVTRLRDTEPPFTGEYVHTKTPGTYRCVCCGSPLFPSDTKFESGSGWPSFWAPHGGAALATHLDESHDLRRVEALCRTCDAHLGHVFDDGPAPTGKRYCINSAALRLDSDKPGREAG